MMFAVSRLIWIEKVIRGKVMGQTRFNNTFDEMSFKVPLESIHCYLVFRTNTGREGVQDGCICYVDRTGTKSKIGLGVC